MQEISYNEITWLDERQPTEQKLLELQKKYGFHELDIEDCLSVHERPKVEEYEDYIFLVIHIPYIGKQSGRILKEEVNIFVGQKYVITLHGGNLFQLDMMQKKLSNSDSERKEYLEHGSGFFLYELMHSFFDGVFPLVDTISRDLRVIEDELFDSEEQSDLLKDIMKLKRNIITMRSILLPQRALIATLEHKNKKFVSEELSLYFDDILDAIERQWSLLETAKELSEALQDTHESLLSHRTNTVIQLLTIFSVTMLPLTFITGLYGMNVPLPFQDIPYMFEMIVLVMGGILGSMFAYFVRKRWL